MTDHMEPFRMELKRLHERIDGISRFEWAQVTSISPLRIHFAGDNNPVAVPPDTITASLVVGDLVRVERKGAHMTIHGVGKGADNPRRFPNKAALDLWATADGASAWVTSESRQYVRSGGVWHGAFEDTGWLTLGLRAGFTGSCIYRRMSGVVEVRLNVTGAAHTVDQQYTDPLPVGFRPRVAGGVMQPLPSYIIPAGAAPYAHVYVSESSFAVHAHAAGASSGISRARSAGQWFAA